jgi:hypothetical protein
MDARGSELWELDGGGPGTVMIVPKGTRQDQGQ